MGLGSRRRTIVGLTVQRVLAEDQMPDSVLTGLTKAVLKQKPNVADYALDELVAGIGIKADWMFNTGKRKSPYGLPTSTSSSLQTGRAEAEEVLTALEGAPVSISYSLMGAANLQHLAWMALVDTYSFDPDSNELPDLGAGIYLADFVITVPEADWPDYAPEVTYQPGPPADAGYVPYRRVGQLPGTLSEDGVHQPIRLETGAASEYLKMTYGWGVIPGVGDPYYDTADVAVAFPTTDDTKEYAQVKYVVGGVTKYWIYELGTGTYPILDNLYGDLPTAGEFFPRVYFRRGKVSQMTNTSTPAYKAASKMMNHLGFGFAEVGAAMEENPDIVDVDTATLMLGVPVYPTHVLETEYLYEYFSRLYADVEADLDAVAAMPWMTSGYTQRISDAASTIYLDVRRIYRRVVSGVIADVGEFAFAVSYSTETSSYYDNDGTLQVNSFTIDHYYYRKQATVDSYIEVEVLDPETYYKLTGNQLVRGEGIADVRRLIPLDRSLTKEFSLRDREALYARSLHLVFTCITVVKLKWYETGLFKFFMVALALVITVLSLGTGFELLVLAIGVGTVAAIVIALGAILLDILVGMLIAYALKLFVKELGVELSLILAVVLLVVGGGKSIQMGGMPGAPWAADLMRLATGLGKAIQDVTKDMMESLVQLQNAQQADMAAREEKLKAAQDLLSDKSSWMAPLFIAGESPDQFYTRTVHSGNIGVMSLDAIGNYVTNALQLPTFAQTI